MELTDLIQHITLNEPHFMWFLGAGAPRSAGLPTAYNIIWDLKRRYYALHENVDISELDMIIFFTLSDFIFLFSVFRVILSFPFRIIK